MIRMRISRTAPRLMPFQVLSVDALSLRGSSSLSAVDLQVILGLALPLSALFYSAADVCRPSCSFATSKESRCFL